MEMVTASFLFTDIEGSTRLWEEYPAQMREALARHDAILRLAVERGGGRIVKTTGDGVLAAFPVAADAVESALFAQQSLGRETWPEPITIRVRMGIHSGAVQQRDGDYYGQTLNRAARLLAIGHGGQTLLSLAAVELARDGLPATVRLIDMGSRRLKDLIRPEQVFQALAPGLPEQFAPLKSLDSFPNNLPQQFTSFLGREEELRETTTRLASSRLVTLTGSGGCGKTRLALQAGADLLENYPDGVWFVELAALSDPALVAAAIAGAIGITDLSGEPLDALGGALQGRTLLLILDNCEHLVEACARTAYALARSCPNVSILATSREALNIGGESVYRIPSLALPNRHPPPTLEGLSQFAAVRLFIERAQSARADFAVTSANAPAVAEVCWRLDGIPLAIELAAARLRSLSVEDLLSRLEDRFRLLTGGSRSALPRQQTLRALIDWSYNLLDEGERKLLARLSVFSGGWTLDAAEGVCSGEGVEDWEVLDLLSSLVDKSLVSLDEREGVSRYRMLETIRQYAQEKAREAGEAETLRERHCRWFRQAVEARFRLFAYENQPLAMQDMAADRDNLRGAIGFAMEQGEDEAVLALAGLTKVIWSVSHMTEMRRYLTAARARLEGTPDSPLRGFALVAEAVYASMLGDNDDALLLAERALRMQRGLGDSVGVSDALHLLGHIYSVLSRFDESIACSEEAVAINRAHGLTNWEYCCIGNIGFSYLLAGNREAAEPFLRKGLEEPGLDKLPNYLGPRLDCLAQLYWETGRREEAVAVYREAIRVNYGDGNWREVGFQLNAFGRIALGAGQMERCVRLYSAAAALRRHYFFAAYLYEQEAADHDLALARASLSAETFDAAWKAGGAMNAAEAVGYALATESEPA